MVKAICRTCKGSKFRRVSRVHASLDETSCPVCDGTGVETIESGYIVERKASGDLPDFGVFDQTETEKAVNNIISSRFMSCPADYFEVVVNNQPRILNNKIEAETYATLGYTVTVRFGGRQSGEYSRITRFGD